MDDDFRQMVIDRLRRSEDLPREWARQLFPPEKREYELVYYDKQREEDILADTMAVPLQPVSTFGKNGDDWHNMLIFGDNLQVLKRLLEMKEQGKLLNADGTPGVRLVYIDPPFATMQEFRGTQDQKAYQDKIAGAQFIEFLRKRLVLIRDLLHSRGAVFVHLDQKKSHYIKIVLDEIFGEHNFRNEIIWRNTNTHSKAATFGQIHQNILMYSRSNELDFIKQKRPRFKQYEDQHYRHLDERGVYRLSDPTGDGIRTGESGEKWLGYNPTEKGRHWAIPGFVYDLIDEDIADLSVLEKLDYLLKAGLIVPPERKGGQPQFKRYKGDEDGIFVQDIWAYQPYTEGIYEDADECVDNDVSWAISKAERTDYPTQKPEGLLSRIIRCCTKEGDLVLDAFAGSGTTLAVAEKLGRRWIGIDCGKLAIYTIQKRMLNLKSEIGNKGRPLKPRPFTVYNAGLYDFSRLRQLSREDWRFFALQLFECKDVPHTIGGIHLDGKRKGHPVLVFDHHANPGKRIDEDTIRDIHAAVGKRIGPKFYLIAPRGVFDFQQDYIDLDGVRYYALRIPYSVINELHHRSFAALRQPNDEMDVNDIVDAWGFDFIQPPQVVYTTGLKKRKGQRISEACLKTKKFESRARIRGEDTRGGFETFSTLMIDYDFNGEVFELDAVLYAHQLEADDWQAWLPAEMIGEKVMAVFLDIYGNEAREVIPRADFDLSKKIGTPAKPRRKAQR